MGKALPFPMHKHPPTKTNLLGDAGAAASAATAASGEDQGEAGEGAEAADGTPGEETSDSETKRAGRQPPGAGRSAKADSPAKPGGAPAPGTPTPKGDDWDRLRGKTQAAAGDAAGDAVEGPASAVLGDNLGKKAAEKA